MNEPKVSCPSFDNAIEEIEKARSINDELRQWGKHWQEEYFILDEQYLKILSEKQEEIEELKLTIKRINDEHKN